MATHCLIARENKDGSYDSIYVHFGHPRSVGALLTRHYTEEDKIARLLALGSLSQLGAEIGEKQDFNHPRPEWCLSFERDRGESPHPSTRCESRQDLVEQARRRFIQHVFVWTTHPATKRKAWAKLQMPEETEASVRATADGLLDTLRAKKPAPLGLDRPFAGGVDE